MAHLVPRNTAIKLIDKYETNCPFEIAERQSVKVSWLFLNLWGDLWDTTLAIKRYNPFILMII